MIVKSIRVIHHRYVYNIIYIREGSYDNSIIISEELNYSLEASKRHMSSTSDGSKNDENDDDDDEEKRETRLFIYSIPSIHPSHKQH